MDYVTLLVIMPYFATVGTDLIFRWFNTVLLLVVILVAVITWNNRDKNLLINVLAKESLKPYTESTLNCSICHLCSHKNYFK